VILAVAFSAHAVRRPDSDGWLAAIPKNARELQTYGGRDQFTQRPVWQCVVHLIFNDGGSIFLPEAMGVHPVFVGTTPLDIDKRLRRVPALNLTLPGEGDPKRCQSVLDARPSRRSMGAASRSRSRVLRRDALQIGRLSKERKDLARGSGRDIEVGERV